MGESEKNRKLFDLLDALEFNQVVIFVKSVQRCIALAKLLQEQNFPAVDIHRAMNQEERLKRYQAFKVKQLHCTDSVKTEIVLILL